MPTPAPQISCELFPPKTPEGRDKLRQTWRRLHEEMQPAWFSVTYGAGGTTREGTWTTICALHEAGLSAAPHLSCIGAERAEIDALLQAYQTLGAQRIVALRGDMPSGMRAAGEFRYAADLIAHIRAVAGDSFHIEAAAYPEFHPEGVKAPQSDLLHFKQKMEAGADSAITQYFYNADAYFRFVDDCRRIGVEAPITPGVMPIGNYAGLVRFSKACGAEIPRWLDARLAAYGEDPASLRALRALGAEVVAQLCQRLLEGGAPGLHFYTLNQAEPTLAVWRALDIDVDKKSRHA